MNFDAKTATVTCKEGCDATAMVAALQKAGFDGKPK